MAKTILVVEDELKELFRQAIEIGCDGEYTVFTAERGDEAVRKARIVRPDLIIMDIRMPRMTGIQATRIIREFLPDVHIIALSAYADKKDEALAAGCNEFWAKPCDILALVNRVKEVLECT